MLKGFIFDFGGVLMRTADPVSRRAWETKLGLPPGGLERAVHGSGLWIKAQRGEISPDAYWRGVAQHLGIAEADIPGLRADYFRDDRLDNELVALIRSLRAAGYRLGLLSNDVAPLEDKLRRELEIYDLFDAVIISAQIRVMKPDPRAYRAMLRAMDVSATESVLIDDNQANIDGARALGMNAIRYQAGMDVQAALAPFLRGEA